MDSSESPLRTGPAIDATGIFLLSVTILVFLVPLCIYFPPIPPSHRDALLETHTPIGVKAEAERRRRRRSKGKKDDVAAGSTNANGMALNGQAKPAAAATVRSLWIYPIKSCKGIEISQSRVLPTGLEHDRIYAFAQLRSPFPVGVDTPEKEKSAHRWEFITQRQFPMLATVQVELFIPDAVKARGRLGEVASEPFLLVRFPWQEPGFRGAMSWVAAKLRGGLRAVPEKQFVLPVAFPSRSEIEKRGYEFEEVTVWRDTVMALNMEKELPWELKQYLGVSNRLGIFHIDPARLRNVYRCAPTKQEAGYQPITGFQDAVSITVTTLLVISPIPLPRSPPSSRACRFHPRDGLCATLMMIPFALGGGLTVSPAVFFFSFFALTLPTTTVSSASAQFVQCPRF